MKCLETFFRKLYNNFNQKVIKEFKLRNPLINDI